MSLLLLLLLAGPAASADVTGGHAEPPAADAPVPTDTRRALLEELWQRRILPPDQKMWSPDDYELLERIRRAEDDALALLKRRTGGYRAWTARSHSGAVPGVPRLTKEGYERYLFLLTQDAIVYFESKGADAKLVFKFKDSDGKALFDARGSITEAGAEVYRRAKLNLEVFWRGPAGEVYGTRRPPAPGEALAPAAAPAGSSARLVLQAPVTPLQRVYNLARVHGTRRKKALENVRDEQLYGAAGVTVEVSDDEGPALCRMDFMAPSAPEFNALRGVIPDSSELRDEGCTGVASRLRWTLNGEADRKRGPLSQADLDRVAGAVERMIRGRTGP